MFDRLSEITLALAKKGGGGGGSTNYNDLDHKPKINNVELAGSLSLSDLDVQEELTAGTGIDITGNTISVDADSAPTKNSQKPVTSGGTKSAIDASQNASLQMLSDTVGWTGKQLIPFPYNDGMSKTNNGVTYTVNADGGITLQTNSGGATANSVFNLIYDSTALNDKPVKGYLSKSKTDLIYESEVEIVYSVRNTDSTQKWSARGTSIDIPLANSPHTADGEYLRLMIRVASGKVITTPITVYPLVCLPSVTDTTYEPYHESVEEEINQVYADNGVLGAKNLFDGWKKTATSNANVTYQKTDKGYRIYMTSAASWSQVYFMFENPRKNTDWAISTNITVTSGSAGIRIMGNSSYSTGSATEIVNNTIQSGHVKQVFNSGNYDYIFVRLSASADNSVQGDVLYDELMFMLATDSDLTYQPYAMTNKELTDGKANNSALAPVENGTTASQVYAQGEYFMHNGSFCKAKTAITSGATLVEDSNYEVTTIGAELLLALQS